MRTASLPISTRVRVSGRGRLGRIVVRIGVRLAGVHVHPDRVPRSSDGDVVNTEGAVIGEYWTGAPNDAQKRVSGSRVVDYFGHYVTIKEPNMGPYD